MEKKTQAQRVIEYIEQFGSISQVEAMRDLGCMRLASRVSDLRKRGYKITGKTERVKNRWGGVSPIKRYSLERGGENGERC